MILRIGILIGNFKHEWTLNILEWPAWLVRPKRLLNKFQYVHVDATTVHKG